MATIDYYNFGVLRNDGNWSAFCLYNDAIRPDRFLTQVETVTSKNDVIQLIETRATSVKARLEARGFQNVILGTTQSSSNNYVYKSITYDAFPTSEDDSGGGDGDIVIPDYTQILTSINTNLTALNTNITNKDNQSDIVSILKTIFCYVRPNGAYYSCIKSNRLNQSSASDDEISYSTIYYKLHSLLQLFYNTALPSSSGVSNSNSIVNDISKKLCFLTPSQNNDNNSIFRILRIIALSLSKDSNVNLSSDSSVISNSSLKDISDKLANSNDLHTISQAIDLISTAIAQLPATDTTGLQTELGKISTAVNNIENNPLFELNANVNGIEVCKKNNKNELDF